MYVLALISIAFKVCSHLGNIPLSTSTSQSMTNESKTVSEQNLSNHKGWPTFSITSSLKDLICSFSDSTKRWTS